MNHSLQDDALLFSAALAMPAAERARFVARACGNDAARRQRVEDLLRSHKDSGEFLEESLSSRLQPNQRLEYEIKLGDLIGRYKIVQKIGEGGCGAVYEADQEEPVRRRVALKVIKLGMDTKTVVARFEAERQALALMDHPNIAHVLDAAATDSGRPYFVMELVRGIAITDYCDHNRLPTKQRVQLFIQVCRAVQHAHQKGVIHRDLKPSNILVTLHDGEPVPKVIDFGIAKATQGRLTDRTLFTAFEQFIGTPAYMSPEQAECTELDVDTRSDIYSLGVLLYELLAGCPPFEPRSLKAAGLDEIRRIIREVDPPRPSNRLVGLTKADHLTAAKNRTTTPAQLSAQLRGDLDWIVMKALEKNRSRRYETVNDFASDAQRHLQNEPVLARSPSAAYRFRKLVARYKAPFTAAAVVLLTLVVGTTLSTWRFLEERKSRQRAVIAEQSEAHERVRAQEAQRTAEQSRGEAELSQREAENQRHTAEESQRQAEADRRVAEKARHDAEQAQTAAVLARQHAETAQQSALTAARTLSAHLYAADMYAVQTMLREKGDLSGVQRILRAHLPQPGEADLRGLEWNYAWQQSQGDKLLSWRTQQGIVRDLVFSPDGRFLASSGRGEPGEQGHVRVWDAASRRLLAQFVDTECISFSPDGTQLLTVTRSGHVHLWRTGSWEALGDFPTANVTPTPNQRIEIAISPTDTIIAICPDSAYGKLGGTVWLYDYKSQKEIARLDDAGCRLAFTPDGAHLITGSTQQGMINIWNVSQGVIKKQLGPVGYISSLSVSRDGRTLAVFSPGKTATVRLWNLKTFLAGRTLACGEQNFLPGAVAFSPNAEWIACAGGDKIVRVWKTATGRPVSTMQGSGNVIWALAFSPDGEQLFTGGRSDQISIWPLTKPKSQEEICITTFAPVRPELTQISMLFNPGNTLLVAADWERLAVFDLRNAIITAKRNGHHRPLWISPDEKILISLNQTYRTARKSDPIATDESTLKSLHAAVLPTRDHPTPLPEVLEVLGLPRLSLHRTLELQAEGPGVEAITASPDGKQVALSWRGKPDVLILNTDSGVIARRLVPRSTQTYALAYSSDSRYLITGGVGIFVEIWDLHTNEPSIALAAHKKSIKHIAFSPDGDTFATASIDQTHKFWSLIGPS